MTTIQVDLRRDTAAGPAIPIVPKQTMEWSPLRQRLEAEFLVLKAPFILPLAGGVGQAEMAGGQYWRVNEGSNGKTRVVLVPETGTHWYHDLPSIDPDTLDEEPADLPAYQVALDGALAAVPGIAGDAVADLAPVAVATAVVAAVAPGGALAGRFPSVADLRRKSSGRWEAQRWMSSAFDPPTSSDLLVITVAALGAAGNISGGVSVRERRIGDVSNAALDLTGDTHFRYKGSPSATALSADPTKFVTAPVKPGGMAQAARWVMLVEFETDAPQVELRTRFGGTNQALPHLRINGQWVSQTIIPRTGTAGGVYGTMLTFPDARTRRIEFAVGGAEGWGGVYVTPGHAIVRPQEIISRRVAVIGDSLTNGSGFAPTGAVNTETYALRLAHLLGADETILAGIGGTRWRPVSGAVGDDALSHYAGRLPAVLAMNPDVIIFDGSRNEPNTDLAGLTQAVTDALALCQGVAEVYVFGTMISGAFAPTNGAIKAGVLAAGRPFFDLAGVIYGTGKLDAPTGDGNADYFTTTDNIHPTHAGHRFLAERHYLAMLGLLSLT